MSFHTPGCKMSRIPGSTSKNDSIQSATTSMSNLRVSDAQQQQNINVSPNAGTMPPGQMPSNHEEHQLLYSVLQQLTRKVNERDQLNEVLEQENHKLKLMLMNALYYCYNEMGETQVLPSVDMSYDQQGSMGGLSSGGGSRRNSNNEGVMNIQPQPRSGTSSGNSSRKSSTDARVQEPPSPRQGIDPYSLEHHARNTHDPQYQHLTNYNFGHKNPQEQHGSFHDLDAYVMQGKQPQPQVDSQYQHLNNYSMTKNHSKEDLTSRRRKPSVEHNYQFNNYSMTPAPKENVQEFVDPQQMPPYDYRRASAYQNRNQFEQPPPQQLQPNMMHEQRRTSSNNFEVEQQSPFPPYGHHKKFMNQPQPTLNLNTHEQKFFNNNHLDRRASLAYMPTGKHVTKDPMRKEDIGFNPQHLNVYSANSPLPHGNHRVGYPEMNANSPEPNRRQSVTNDVYQQTQRKRKSNASNKVSFPQNIAQPQPTLNTPPPGVEKMFGNLPARRSSVIYTPGPTPKEIRQQQEKEKLEKEKLEKEKQVLKAAAEEQLAQQKAAPLSMLDTKDGGGDDRDGQDQDDDQAQVGSSPVGDAGVADENSSFMTYYSESDSY